MSACEASYLLNGRRFQCQRDQSDRGPSYAHKFHRWTEDVGGGATMTLEWREQVDTRWNKKKVISLVGSR